MPGPPFILDLTDKKFGTFYNKKNYLSRHSCFCYHFARIYVVTNDR